MAASDYVRAVSEQDLAVDSRRIVPLGTDGLGRSDTRESLRRHFEVDAECDRRGRPVPTFSPGGDSRRKGRSGDQDLGVNPEKVNPMFA